MNKKTSRGFSLLEIIIGMLILSLVVAGMVGLFVSTNRFIIQAGHRLVALNYARQVAETLKVYVSASPTVGTLTNAGTEDGCALDGDAAVDADGYTHIDLNGDGTMDAELHENPHTDLAIPNVTAVLTGVTNQDCDYTVDEDVLVVGNATTLESVTVTVNWTEP